MSDNVTTEQVTTPGATFAADDIGGVHYARTKVVIGADGVNDGDVSSANPLPVTGTVALSAMPNEGQQAMAGSISVAIASDQSAVPVSDGGGVLTVDGTVDVDFRDNVTVTGTIDSGNPLAIACDGADAVAWEIGAGLTNVQFEATIDGTTWFAIDAILLTGSVVSSVTSAPNRGFFETVGYEQVRLIAPGGSGTARLLKTDSPAVIRTFPAARAALTSDSMANPTVEQKAAHMIGHDTGGSTWSRLKVADNGYLIVQGKVGDGTAMAGRPLPTGVRASNAEPGTVSSLASQYLWGDLRGRIVATQKAATATVTSVGDSTSSVQLLASTVTRLGATVYNDSSALMYLKLGTTASATDFTVKLAQDDFYELPFGYYGRVDAIWAADSGGAALITEIS
jgi:hypothetical protein